MYGWKENSMLTNCLAACAHLTVTVSEIERDIVRKSSIFHTHFYSTPPLGGFPSEYRHPVWYGKTRMAWLPDDEKKCEDIFIRFRATHERDGQTDTASQHAYTALMHMHRAVKLSDRSSQRGLTATTLYILS